MLKFDQFSLKILKNFINSLFTNTKKVKMFIFFIRFNNSVGYTINSSERSCNDFLLNYKDERTSIAMSHSNSSGSTTVSRAYLKASEMSYPATETQSLLII